MVANAMNNISPALPPWLARLSIYVPVTNPAQVLLAVSPLGKQLTDVDPHRRLFRFGLPPNKSRRANSLAGIKG